MQIVIFVVAIWQEKGKSHKHWLHMALFLKSEEGLFQKPTANLTSYFTDQNWVTFLNQSLVKTDGIILSQPGPSLGLKLWLAFPEAHGCMGEEWIHGRKSVSEEGENRCVG